MIVERYSTWFLKKVENLQKTKGMEAKLLLTRIQSLQEPTSLFELKGHVTLLHKVLTEYAQEKRNLKWLESLVRDAKEWKDIVISDLSLSAFSVDAVTEALAHDHIEVEQALDLLETF